MSQPKKFVAQRTAAISQVLEELWTLRPELYRRNSMIVYLGALALIEEAKEHNHLKKHLPALEKTMQEEKPIAVAAATPSNIELDSEPHPDSSWSV